MGKLNQLTSLQYLLSVVCLIWTCCHGRTMEKYGHPVNKNSLALESCTDPLYRYHRATGLCHRINRQGPCKQRQKFYDLDEIEGLCDCISDANLLYWAETDDCYYPNTQGPCSPGEWIVLDCGIAKCQKVPAGCIADGYHFFWHYTKDQPLKCYRLLEQGPCPDGYRFRRDRFRNICSDNLHYNGLKQSHEQCPLGSRRASLKKCFHVIQNKKELECEHPTRENLRTRHSHLAASRRTLLNSRSP